MKAVNLIQYLRKNRGGKRVKSGVMLAKKVKTKKGKRVFVGWSKCKLTVDKFNREIGLQIAEGRIDAHKKEKKTKLPPSIKDQVKAFAERCKVYYKTKEVKVV